MATTIVIKQKNGGKLTLVFDNKKEITEETIKSLIIDTIGEKPIREERKS